MSPVLMPHQKQGLFGYTTTSDHDKRFSRLPHGNNHKLLHEEDPILHGQQSGVLLWPHLLMSHPPSFLVCFVAIVEFFFQFYPETYPKPPTTGMTTLNFNKKPTSLCHHDDNTWT
jgi:hypothetical protein